MCISHSQKYANAARKTCKLPDACELCGRRETPILEIARSKDFSLEKLKEALKRSSEIH